jgi:transposase, IS30 family
MPYGPSRSLRRRFWLLIRAGVLATEAGVGVGASRSTGTRWFAQAGGMPWLSLVPAVPGRHLSLADREAILAGLSAGESYAVIGRWIGRATSTVIRELEVNRQDGRRPMAAPAGRRVAARGPLPTELNYSPVVAQRRFEQRLSRRRASKLADNPRLRSVVAARRMVSAAPAIPLVPETLSTKSSDAALRSWCNTTIAVPGLASQISLSRPATR